MSGVDLERDQIRKGAADAIEKYVRGGRGEVPGLGAERPSRGSRARGARRWWWPRGRRHSG